ncbi:MAG: exopolysaccharide biosynthesis protein, partial [Verrucomicrobia bacterium]|nr:exopolysaccharide biosynthesis protein [Verrucomicrobiota bacterium]
RWFFSKVEWIIKPRLRWIGKRSGRVGMGFLVFCMAALMIVPIPLTNTLPAMVIFLIGVGLSEEDGLFAIFACALGVLAVLLYGALIYAFIAFGPEVIGHIKDWLRALVGR